MFDEYYVVLCGTYRSTSTNECAITTTNTRMYFIIARSFARPPSLLLLCPMVIYIGITLFFEVMITVSSSTCLTRILVLYVMLHTVV